MQPKWWLSYPEEEDVKKQWWSSLGFSVIFRKPTLQSFNHSFYVFWLHTETQIKTFGHLHYIIPPSILAIKTLQNLFIFWVSAFSKFLFGKVLPVRNSFAPDTTMWSKSLSIPKRKTNNKKCLVLYPIIFLLLLFIRYGILACKHTWWHCSSSILWI